MILCISLSLLHYFKELSCLLFESKLRIYDCSGNLLQIYGPCYCSISFPFSLSGCLICSFAELRVTRLWTSFLHVNYSLKTRGSRLCVCTKDLLFVRFYVLNIGKVQIFIQIMCVSCSASRTVSLEICFAALEVDSCMYHKHICFNPIKNLWVCVCEIYIVLVIIFNSVYANLVWIC